MKMLQICMQKNTMNAQETTNMEKSVFATLNAINCNDKVEKKGNLSYLSWAWAWQIVKSHYPDAGYTIYEDANGIPYFTDGKTCWVKTGVTIQGLEHIEYLPIMEFRSQAIPLERVTSTDMNKAIQRSLTKACARHGLGLYIYAGEDLPEGEEKPVQSQPSAAVQMRRQATGRSKQIAQPIQQRYTPVGNEEFWKMVDHYVKGIPAKSGEDYRTAWINFTHAGVNEIAMFDDAVINYRINNNL
jgi:hypothetical protein